MEHGTGALRVSAPEWSLAGDRQLLDVLRTIHQKIMTKCHETNCKLEQMVNDLDNASVSLQNVNNRFMALSNSQFIESRVYDDDADITTEPTLNKPPAAQPDVPSELAALSAGLRRFEALHEAVSLVQDSDSGSDSDDVESVILRPKDVYSERPLPYIIGSNDWKMKWHAGLITEDSDTDSEMSRPDDRGPALYSESESDAEPANNISAPGVYAEQGSTTSSEPSEDIRQTSKTQTADIQTSNKQTTPSQAEIAAALARRLGGGVEMPVKTEMERESPPTQRKVYKPHQPSAGTVFCDEPPPLDPSSEDDDIFAEINKHAPYSATHRAHSRGGRADVFDDLSGESGFIKPPTQPAKQHTPLFGDDEDSSLFAEKPQKPTTVEPVKSGIKKPVGAISVFGNNKGADSIGAAILKRNQRKSSSSEEESIQNIDERQKSSIQNIDERQIAPREKDIFDDLFAQSDKTQKVVPNKIEIKVVSKNAPEIYKVDLFSDDIFDDIDDIFATNIPKVPVKEVSKSGSKVKSLFDDNDDDDDLFADVVFNKSDVKDVKSDKNAKGLLDSDDELFREKSEAKIAVVNKDAPKPSVIVNTSQIEEKAKPSKGLFDSDDELFSKQDNKESKNNNTGSDSVETTAKSEESRKTDNTKSILRTDEKLFASNKQSIDSLQKQENETKKSKALFEEETDSNDMFSYNDSENVSNNKTNDFSNSEHEPTSIHKINLINKEKEDHKSTILNTKTISGSKSQFRSPSLFDDENDADDLFEQVKHKDNSVIKTSKNLDNVDNVIKPMVAKLETEKDLITENKEITSEETANILSDKDKVSSQSIAFNSPNIFGSDDDDDMGNDLCSKTSKSPVISTKPTVNATPKCESYIGINKPVINSKNNTDSDIPRVKNDDINKRKETSSDIYTQDANTVLDNKQINLDANRNVEKDTDAKTTKTTVSSDHKIDIVPDIFAELPPAFEKPKEPKRSKNINALFDDDSDDEALFLRKEDNISDEKPSDVTTSVKDPIFALFHDEPPAIDVDFEAKATTAKAAKPTERQTTNNDNMQNKLNTPKQETLDNTDGGTQSKKEEIKPIGKLKPMNFNINVNTLLPGASPKKTVKPINDTPESPPEPKEVVSKLVKSASFEKDPDSPVLNTKISKERAKIQVKRRPSSRRARIEAVRKSAIDFGDDVDGNDKFNDSDNDTMSPNPENIEENGTESKLEAIPVVSTESLSKPDERAPIEEVKTQVLNINEDDIYIFRNPNIQASTADVPKSEVTSENKTEVVKDNEGITTLGQVYDAPKVEPKSKRLNIIDDDDNIFKITSKSTTVKTQEVVSSLGPETISMLNDDDDDGNDIFNSKAKVNKEISRSDEKTIKASLFDDSDDDDIFKTKVTNTISQTQENIAVSPKDTEPQTLFKAKAANIADDSDDDDDMFKVIAKQSNEPKDIGNPKDDVIPKNYEDTLKTLAPSSSTGMNKVIKESAIKRTEKNTIFDDISDDELFGGNKKALDSDEELFSNKRKPVIKADDKKPTEIKKVEVKKSLFGDDDDDDDLFGATTSKTAATTKPSKPAKEPTKSTEPVFNDPLSMLQDDDDY